MVHRNTGEPLDTVAICEGCEGEFEDDELTDGHCCDCLQDLEYERNCEMRELANDPDSPYFMADRFADPGGDSCLYPETDDNPRNLACPNCGAPNVLTPADRAAGYQCDSCARQAEMGY